MKNPCIDCEAPKRHPGCHETCQEGIIHSKYAKDKRELAKAEKSQEAMFNNFKVQQILRVKQLSNVR